MFGIYPAGPQWMRQLTSSVSALVLKGRLKDLAGMSAGNLAEPFGPHRGAVIAENNGFLVLANKISDTTEVVVVPDVKLQYLLWSFNTGNADQWAGREIKIMTDGKLETWDALLVEATHTFRWTVSLVEQAIAGTLVETKQQCADGLDNHVPEIDSYFDDTWVPISEYAPFEGDVSCAP